MNTVPYTYLIGWSNLKVYYYGVRFANGCHPAELWKTYFTSSIYVEEFVKQHGNPDIIKIRQTFNEVPKAQLWEHRVLKRMRVIYRNDFLNRTDNKSIAPQYGNNNPATRPEVRQKIANNTPRKYGDNNPMRDPLVADKVRKKRKGKSNTWSIGEANPAKRPEVRAALKVLAQGKGNGFYGETHSLAQKEKWSLERSGISKPKCSCIKCHTEIGINGITRHYKSCKS